MPYGTNGSIVTEVRRFELIDRQIDRFKNQGGRGKRKCDYSVEKVMSF